MVKREYNKGVSKFWVDTDREQRTQQHYHQPEENGSDTTKGVITQCMFLDPLNTTRLT